MITRKSAPELELMRAANGLVASVLAALRRLVAPGVSTLELDAVAERQVLEAGAVPAFKGYHGYPATLCASVNDAVVHGIPSATPLVEGDIVSIDMGLQYGGYHVDMAFTAPVGAVPPRVRELLDAARESLYEGAARARPGGRIGDIGHAIESSVRSKRFGIIRQYVGHGIGRQLHERPSVPNYGKPNTLNPIEPGLCIAIEPMITLGTWKTKTLKDRWTVVTADGSLAAHFEHTIAVTESGPEILTTLERQLR